MVTPQGQLLLLLLLRRTSCLWRLKGTQGRVGVLGLVLEFVCIWATGPGKGGMAL
jgi:hypothetical protein